MISAFDALAVRGGFSINDHWSTANISSFYIFVSLFLLYHIYSFRDLVSDCSPSVSIIRCINSLMAQALA